MESPLTGITPPMRFFVNTHHSMIYDVVANIDLKVYSRV